MKKKVAKFTAYLVVFSTLFFLFCNCWVYVRCSDETTYQLKNVKAAKTALILGTSKFLASGKPNDYYKNRIEAVCRLYEAKKIKYIICSGDNSTADYNEPKMMRDDLIKMGIPSNVIFLDYAGFRTLDSVVRCKEIFGQNEVIVVSQKFHNERAIFIAQSFGISMKGYNAEDVTAYSGFKTNLREKFARVKVVLDLIFGVEPKFLGKKVKIA